MRLTQLEERRVLGQQAQEDPVALPERKERDFCLVHPFQHALVAFVKRSGKSRAGEQVHLLILVQVGEKVHHAALVKLQGLQAGLLQHFPLGAVFRGLARLKLAAHADPLVPVGGRFFCSRGAASGIFRRAPRI